MEFGGKEIERERDGGDDERALWDTRRASGQGDVNGDPLFALAEADGQVKGCPRGSIGECGKCHQSSCHSQIV